MKNVSKDLRVLGRTLLQTADLLDGRAKPEKHRTISAAGRNRIAAAQRARWAKVRKAA